MAVAAALKTVVWEEVPPLAAVSPSACPPVSCLGAGRRAGPRSSTSVQWVVVEMRITSPGAFQPPALCPPQLPKELTRGGPPFVHLENGFSSLQPRGLETACGRVGCRGHSMTGWGSGGQKLCLQSSSGWRKHQIVTSKNESPKHHAI